MDKRNISVTVNTVNGGHHLDIVGSLHRIAECHNMIIAERPISGAKLLRVLQRAEATIDGITLAEIEYASYLAGMAETVR